MALEGIDVYSGSGGVEWHRVAAAGKTFAFIRAAYGDVADKAAVQNFVAAKAAGLLVGLYGFFRVTKDPGAQLNMMREALAKAGCGKGDLPPAIDVEDNPHYDGPWKTSNNGKYIDGLRAWIAGVKADIGRDPVIYTRTSFWSLLGDPPDFGASPLWISRYAAKAGALPAQWPAYAFWQYSETGSVDGVGGDCDLNRFNGDITQLNAMTLP